MCKETGKTTALHRVSNASKMHVERFVRRYVRCAWTNLLFFKIALRFAPWRTGRSWVKQKISITWRRQAAMAPQTGTHHRWNLFSAFEDLLTLLSPWVGMWAGLGLGFCVCGRREGGRKGGCGEKEGS